MASERLVEQLVKIGNTLASPPESAEELYSLLDHIDKMLSGVEQSPPQSVLTGIKPLSDSLVAKELLYHLDPDVKVAVASCISEVTRISAPDVPYPDDILKEIFHLIVGSFEALHETASRTFAKRVSILETVAKVRSCVLMLDLECDSLILDMFHYFLSTIRMNTSEKVYSLMETIMTLVIQESEEISSELLSSLLAVVKMDNKDVEPMAQKLVESVMSECADKLKSCIVEFVKSADIHLSDYSMVVTSMFQEHVIELASKETNTGDNVAEDNELSERTISDKTLEEQGVGSAEKLGADADNSPKMALHNGSVTVEKSDVIAETASPGQQPEIPRHNEASPGQQPESPRHNDACNENVENSLADCDNMEVAIPGYTPDVNVSGQNSNQSARLTDNSDFSRLDNDVEKPTGHTEDDKSPEVGMSDMVKVSAFLRTPEKKIEIQPCSVVESTIPDDNPSESVRSDHPQVGFDKEALLDSSTTEGRDDKEAEPSQDDLPANQEVPTASFDPERTNEVEHQSVSENMSPDDATKSPSESLLVSAAQSKEQVSGGSLNSGKTNEDQHHSVSEIRPRDDAANDSIEILTDSTQSKNDQSSQCRTTNSKAGNPVAKESACSSRQKGSPVKNRTQNEVALLAKEEVSAGSSDSEKTKEDQHHPLIENVCLDDAKPVSPSSRKETTKLEVGNPVTKEPARSSGQKGSLENNQIQNEAVLLNKEEVSAGSSDPEKMNKDQPHPLIENVCVDNAEHVSSTSRKKKTKSKVGNPVTKESVRSSRQKGSLDKNRTKKEANLSAKEDMSAGSSDSEKTNEDHPHPLTENAHVDATEPVCSTSRKDSQDNSESQDEEIVSKDNPKEPSISEGNSQRVSDKKIQLEVAAVNEEPETVTNDAEVEPQRRVGKKGVKRKAPGQRSSGNKNYSKRRQKGQVTHEDDKPGKLNSKVPETSEANDEQGDDIVGLRIQVWWPADKKFYHGVIDSFNPETKKHKVIYDDGDEEVLLMKNEKWKIAKGETKIDAGKGKHVQGTDASQNSSRTQAKGKGVSNSSSKKSKTPRGKSMAESGDKDSKRVRTRTRGGSSSNDEELDDNPTISKISKGKSVAAKAKTLSSSGKLKAEPEKSPKEKTNDQDTSKTSNKSEGAPSKSSRKAKTAKLSNKLKEEKTAKPNKKPGKLNLDSDSDSGDDAVSDGEEGKKQKRSRTTKRDDAVSDEEEEKKQKGSRTTKRNDAVSDEEEEKQKGSKTTKRNRPESETPRGSTSKQKSVGKARGGNSTGSKKRKTRN